jgi:hypothetical protein
MVLLPNTKLVDLEILKGVVISGGRKEVEVQNMTIVAVGVGGLEGVYSEWWSTKRGSHWWSRRGASHGGWPPLR